MRENLVNYRTVTFDNKDCTMTSKFIETRPLNVEQHSLICITPEQFNKGFVKWQDKQCK